MKQISKGRNLLLPLLLTMIIMPLLSVTGFCASVENTSSVNVSNYKQLKAAVENKNVDTIIITKDIDVPCESVSRSKDLTVMLNIDRSLSIESPAGEKYTIRRIAASKASGDALTSLFGIEGSGYGGGYENVKTNTVEVSFKNIVIDGGAEWNGEFTNSYTPGNSGVSGRSIIDVYRGAVLDLEYGAEIRNGSTTEPVDTTCSDSGVSRNYGGAVRVDYTSSYGGGIVNIKAGSEIHDCMASEGYGGAVGAYNYSYVNMAGGSIYNCAAERGGAIGCTYRAGMEKADSCIFTMYGGKIYNCYAAVVGGAVVLEGDTSGYLYAGEINDCASPTGGFAGINDGTFRLFLPSLSSYLLRVNNCGESVADYDAGYSGIGVTSDATLSILEDMLSTVSVEFIASNSVMENYAFLTTAKQPNDLGGWVGASFGSAFPGDPIREGYIFDGWYDNTDFYGSPVDADTAFEKSTVLFAKWSDIPEEPAPELNELNCTGLPSGLENVNAVHKTVFTIPVYLFFALIGIAAAVAVYIILYLYVHSDSDILNFRFVIYVFLLLNALVSVIAAKIFGIVLSIQTNIHLGIPVSLETVKNSGIVYYGGVIVFLLVLAVLANDVGISLDIVAVCIPVFHAFGRIGCFFAGCCYGIVSSNKFSYLYTNIIDGAAVSERRIPVQLLGAGAELVIFIALLILLHKRICSKRLDTVYFLLYSFARFWLEFLRGDRVTVGVTPLSLAQMLSILIFAISFGILRFSIKRYGMRNDDPYNTSKKKKTPETNIGFADMLHGGVYGLLIGLAVYLLGGISECGAWVCDLVSCNDHSSQVPFLWNIDMFLHISLLTTLCGVSVVVFVYIYFAVAKAIKNVPGRMNRFMADSMEKLKRIIFRKKYARLEEERRKAEEERLRKERERRLREKMQREKEDADRQRADELKNEVNKFIKRFDKYEKSLDKEREHYSSAGEIIDAATLLGLEKALGLAERDSKRLSVLKANNDILSQTTKK